jgi:uncharacterized protein (DUF4415 family)
MAAKKGASRRSLKSDLKRVDAHVTKGGRPVSANPRRLITIRLPSDVIAKWRSTGPGWQTRMAERLSKAR